MCLQSIYLWAHVISQFWLVKACKLLLLLQTCIVALYERQADVEDIVTAMCEAYTDRSVIKFLRAITAYELCQRHEHYSVFIPGIDAYQ